DAEELASADTGNLLIHSVQHRAIQRQIAIIHDNANRQRGIDRVTVQHRITIDGAQCAAANLIIEDRSRSDSDVIHHIFHSRCSVYQINGGVAANIRARFTAQRGDAVFYGDIDKVENAVVSDLTVVQLAVELRHQ